MLKALRHSIKNLNIDWTNHTVAFLATVFGILIALGLDDWNDNRKERAAIALAVESLQEELRGNFQIIDDNLKRLQKFAGLNSAILKFRTGDIPDNLQVKLACTRTQFDSLKAIYPEGITDASIVDGRRDSRITIYAYWDGFFPEKLNFDNWDAIKASGLLYKFDRDKMIAFNRVYSQLQRNAAGVSEDDIVMMQVQDDKLSLPLFEKTVGSFRFSNEMKLQFTHDDYEKILAY